jgi:diguanylate cyclase
VGAGSADEQKVEYFVISWRAWLVLALGVLAWPAWGGPLTLDARTRSIDAWPAVTALADPDAALDLAEVMARRDEFAAPRVPHANFGVRDGALWLRVPLQAALDAAPRWVLSIDYATLDRVDLHLLRDGRLLRHAQLGRAQPFAQRPLPSHLHSVELELEPGREHELFLRVQTQGTAIVPIVLLRPEVFHQREVGTQMLQGVVAGVALCLMLYSLAQWASLRERMFLHYAVVMLGTIVFFFAYYGFGPQHLWPRSEWLTAHVGPLSVLVGLMGVFLFIERALEAATSHPRIAKALRAGASVCATVSVLFVAGAIDFRTTQLVGTLLGPLPMLLGLPVAYARARGNDRVGAYLLAGWAVYALGTLVLVGLVRGLLPFNLGTQHAFQIGAMFEMLIWVGVLAVRIEHLRDTAQRARLERDALHSLAVTDSLTGLPNRRGLADLLSGALAQSSAARATAVFLLDLDGFKAVNDRLGHEAGDEVLVGVAGRLRSLLRSSDAVARLGGDEFVVVASGLAGDADAQALGRKLLDGFREPFGVAGQRCSIGLTIGYALAPLDAREADDLLRRADEAMYAGKQAGRHCLRRSVAATGLASA